MFSDSRLIFLLFLALALGCFVFWQYRRTKLKPFVFCFVLYLFGVVCVATALLPESEFTPVSAEDRVPLLILGLALLTVAGLWHLYMFKFRPHQLDRDKKPYLVIGICVVTILCVHSFFSGTRGYSRWVPYLVAGAVTFVLLLLVVFRRASVWPENGMVRRMQAEEYGEAIVLGESVPEAERSAVLKVNLGAAYYLTGRADDARRMFDALAADPKLPSQLRSMVQGWRDRIAEADAGPAPPGTGSIPEPGAEAAADGRG